MITSLRGVTLCRVEHKHIEMLRNWRNDSKIASNMFYQEHITPEMQEKWFKTLNVETDFYFIIEVNKEPIGLINLSQIDYNKKEGQVGLFIYNQNFWGTPAPVIASLMLLNFAFEYKKLNCVWAKVRKENISAQNYNKMLGFKKIETNLQQLRQQQYKNITRPLLQKIIQ